MRRERKIQTDTQKHKEIRNRLRSFPWHSKELARPSGGINKKHGSLLLSNGSTCTSALSFLLFNQFSVERTSPCSSTSTAARGSRTSVTYCLHTPMRPQLPTVDSVFLQTSHQMSPSRWKMDEMNRRTVYHSNSCSVPCRLWSSCKCVTHRLVCLHVS